jgi:peptide-methionine (S)-S-oxide reductase
VFIQLIFDLLILEEMSLATFGGGCFWCVEACFQLLKGVQAVKSGYAGSSPSFLFFSPPSGGHVLNPTYKQVCSGTTGHAEVVQVAFDPVAISYLQLLEAFFKAHDPTTLNRQGHDEGTQYRSVIYFHSPEQQAQANLTIAKLTEAKLWPSPIVTEVSPIPIFYPAEDYHQTYFEQNPEQGYVCDMFRIGPSFSLSLLTFSLSLLTFSLSLLTFSLSLLTFSLSLLTFSLSLLTFSLSLLIPGIAEASFVPRWKSSRRSLPIS